MSGRVRGEEFQFQHLTLDDLVSCAVHTFSWQTNGPESLINLIMISFESMLLTMMTFFLFQCLFWISFSFIYKPIEVRWLES